MHRDDLLTGIRIKARLHGRREALRVLHTVLDALAATAPPGPMRELRAQVPPPAGTAGRSGLPGDLIGSVARALGVEKPEAAFLTRQVFGQLNVWCHGVTPADLAADLPAALTGLVTARPESADPVYARHLSAFSAGMPLLIGPPPVKAQPVEAPAVEAPIVAAVVPAVRRNAAARQAYPERA